MQPVLTMDTIITGVREIKAGQRVGYNGTFTAPKDMRVATIPVGYFEGLDRRLSNCGSLLLKKQEVPIVGRISMNITSLDVSRIPNLAEGEIVNVISPDPKKPNSIINLAAKAQTIPYVLLVHLPAHLKRRVIE